ncbi:MAG: hypothetical protein ACRDKE_05945 [Solirubrobacterales bacterium]
MSDISANPCPKLLKLGGPRTNRRSALRQTDAVARVIQDNALPIQQLDEHANPKGSRGAGIVGSNAAMANAIHHATGIRVHDLAVTCDTLLG